MSQKPLSKSDKWGWVGALFMMWLLHPPAAGAIILLVGFTCFISMLHGD